MRTAIFLGLAMIANAIRPQEISAIISATIFTLLCLLMDFSEYGKKYVQKNLEK